MATIERERILELLTALVTGRIARVSHPAIRLHEHSRAKVDVAVPPVRGARRRAARTQNALVQTIEAAALRGALEVLLAFGSRAGRLQVWLNRTVLLVELSQVRHKVLDNVSVGQRVDLRSVRIAVNTAQASKGVDAIDVHGTATANALTARATERESRVHLVLDLQQGIQHHRTGAVQVNLVRLHFRLHSGKLRVLVSTQRTQR